MVAHSSEYVDVSTVGLSDVKPEPAHLPRQNATVSYWMTTPGRLPDSSYKLPKQSDIVIIGSGITGVSCAYQLALSLPSNSSIAIIEARSFCSGATGRNGGHLTPISALAYTDLAANPEHLMRNNNKTRSLEVHTEVDKILTFEANVADRITRLISSHDKSGDVGLTVDNNWHLCFKDEEVDAFEASLEAAKQAGLHSHVAKVVRVPTGDLKVTMNNPVGVVAAYQIPGATLHPRNLAALIYHLAREEAQRRNIDLELITETPVTDVISLGDAEVTGYTTSLKTARGDTIVARYVVHATNAYASHLIPCLEGPKGIVPTRAQVVAVEPLQPRKRYWAMGTSAGGGYEYGHQRPPSTFEPNAPFVFGGGREYAPGREWGVDDDSALNPIVSSFLRPYMASVFPREFSEQPSREWTGIIGYTSTKDPLVGPINAPGQYIAAGYSGHGMTRAFGCAEIIAQMITCKEIGKKWACPDEFPQCYLTSAAASL